MGATAQYGVETSNQKDKSMAYAVYTPAPHASILATVFAAFRNVMTFKTASEKYDTRALNTQSDAALKIGFGV